MLILYSVFAPWCEHGAIVPPPFNLWGHKCWAWGEPGCPPQALEGSDFCLHWSEYVETCSRLGLYLPFSLGTLLFKCIWPTVRCTLLTNSLFLCTYWQLGCGVGFGLLGVGWFSVFWASVQFGLDLRPLFFLQFDTWPVSVGLTCWKLTSMLNMNLAFNMLLGAEP